MAPFLDVLDLKGDPEPWQRTAAAWARAAWARAAWRCRANCVTALSLA